MDKLHITSAGGSLFPIEIGRVVCAEISGESLTMLAAAKLGQTQLGDALGLAWPGPGEVSQNTDRTVIWFDHDHVLLIGADDPDLPQNCAATDVSGGGGAVL